MSPEEICEILSDPLCAYRSHYTTKDVCFSLGDHIRIHFHLEGNILPICLRFMLFEAMSLGFNAAISF